jgi:hypothetical protein
MLEKIDPTDAQFLTKEYKNYDKIGKMLSRKSKISF